MKNSLLKTSIFALLLAMVFASCEKNNEISFEEQNQEINTEPTKDAVLHIELGQKNIEIAKIQKDGHEFSFIAIGNDDELAVTETLYGNAIRSGKLRLSKIKGITPLDLFLEITDQNIAIPHRIMINAGKTTQSVLGRTISSKDAEILKIEDPNYHSLINKKGGSDVGAATFQSNHCEFPLTSTANNIEFCDLGPFTSRTRNSRFGGVWQEVNYSLGRANNIGDTQRIRHFAWERVNGTWQWVLKFRYDFCDSVRGSWLNSSQDTERRVIYSRPTGTGSTRSFTRFIDN